MIIIKKSPTADSRCCNCKNTSIEVLRESTISHKFDVANAMSMFASMMEVAAAKHDDHKLETMEAFHKAFQGGFIDNTWWNEHKKELHHLPAEREDINMVHIFEFISDCVTAGLGRTGKVRPLTISNEMLQKAFQNTVNLLIANIKVEE